jgi:7,8-dihydropterin-6-yl-methyl-4-(beta-D-ribofuranosyl)aminobenzene 5'-phosphate synthase
VRIICVIDNTAQWASQLWGEHGLTFLIEAQDQRILFDTGQSGTVLLHNLEVLGVDPASIDMLALSHAHSDHAGGLAKLMENIRPGIPLYAHREIFRERYSKRDERIIQKSFRTPREAIENIFSLHLHDEPQEIFSGVWTTGGITDRPEPEGRSADHLMLQGEDLVSDAYLDDMALVIEMGDGLMLLCGCCHAGLLNTLAHVERIFQRNVIYIAGGLHLISSSQEQLQHVSEILASKTGLMGVYPSHCSGEAAFVELRNQLGDAIVKPCPAGTVIELDI